MNLGLCIYLIQFIRAKNIKYCNITVLKYNFLCYHIQTPCIEKIPLIRYIKHVWYSVNLKCTLNIWSKTFSNKFYYLSLLFTILSKKDGSIEFEEFIRALSITSRGNLDEKLHCKYMAFKICLRRFCFLNSVQLHEIVWRFKKIEKCK